MKKVLLTASAALFAVTVLFTGCSQKEVEVKDGSATYVDPELQGAPSWVMIPSVKGFVAEVGSAPKNAGNDFSFQREEALMQLKK